MVDARLRLCGIATGLVAYGVWRRILAALVFRAWFRIRLDALNSSVRRQLRGEDIGYPHTYAYPPPHIRMPRG